MTDNKHNCVHNTLSFLQYNQHHSYVLCPANITLPTFASNHNSTVSFQLQRYGFVRTTTVRFPFRYNVCRSAFMLRSSVWEDGQAWNKYRLAGKGLTEMCLSTWRRSSVFILRDKQKIVQRRRQPNQHMFVRPLPAGRCIFWHFCSIERAWNRRGCGVYCYARHYNTANRVTDL